MKSQPRVIEITGCCECPHLDRRWEYPPYSCVEGGLLIYMRQLSKLPEKCPLQTKQEYLEENK